MGRRVYFGTDLLCHSLISGMGVYETSGALERLPVGTAEDSALGVPLRNIFSGEFFFVKRLSLRGAMPETHRIRIQNPPDRSLILWPSDMILLAEDSPAQTDFRAANVYDELRLPPPEGSADYGLLFPYRDYPPAEPLDYLLSRVERSGGHGWQNAHVRSIAMHLAETLQGLNQSRYYFFDFTPSRMLVDENEGVFLDYSPLVIPRWELSSGNAALREENLTLRPSMYPLEFAEPALVEGVCRQADERMQNYSLAAFLFWLFFGAYAYDGRLLEHYPDRDAMEHYTKFRQYHKKPVFVFDPDDLSNRLGAADLESDQGAIQLWEAAPQRLKDTFLSVLREDNATRSSPTDRCLKPGQWLQLFASLGWQESFGEPEA